MSADDGTVEIRLRLTASQFRRLQQMLRAYQRIESMARRAVKGESESAFAARMADRKANAELAAEVIGQVENAL